MGIQVELITNTNQAKASAVLCKIPAGATVVEKPLKIISSKKQR